MNKENILSHELIGLNAEIISSHNKSLIGLYGKIVNETKFMFTLKTEKGLKHFPKDTSHWRLDVNGQKIEFDGSKLTKRPFERMGVKA